MRTGVGGEWIEVARGWGAGRGVNSFLGEHREKHCEPPGAHTCRVWLMYSF